MTKVRGLQVASSSRVWLVDSSPLPPDCRLSAEQAGQAGQGSAQSQEYMPITVCSDGSAFGLLAVQNTYSFTWQMVDCQNRIPYSVVEVRHIYIIAYIRRKVKEKCGNLKERFVGFPPHC